MLSGKSIGKTSLFVGGLVLATGAVAAESQLERGLSAIHAMSGCYLVDYNFVETVGLQPGYSRDSRVYDANVGRTIKEWIFAEDITPTRVRLQHVLFATELKGDQTPGLMMKHEGDDWEFQAPFLYEFTKTNHWAVKTLAGSAGQWTRRVTNLDDGLRYQCAADWDLTTANPEWSCATFSQVPGRETRDMGRRDYNTLDRSSRLIVYGQSWLERQANTKTIQSTDGSKTPLAKELGRNWYVRLADRECDAAASWAAPRKLFWQLQRQVWDDVLTGQGEFIEQTPRGQPPRYVKMMELEAKYAWRDLASPGVQAEAKAAMTKLIEEYRAAATR